MQAKTDLNTVCNAGNAHEEAVLAVIDDIWDLVEEHDGQQGKIYRAIAERIVAAEATV